MPAVFISLPKSVKSVLSAPAAACTIGERVFMRLEASARPALRTPSTVGANDADQDCQAVLNAVIAVAAVVAAGAAVDIARVSALWAATACVLLAPKSWTAFAYFICAVEIVIADLISG